MAVLLDLALLELEFFLVNGKLSVLVLLLGDLLLNLMLLSEILLDERLEVFVLKHLISVADYPLLDLMDVDVGFLHAVICCVHLLLLLDLALLHKQTKFLLLALGQ